MSLVCVSQDLQSIGLRGGFTSGLTYKRFFAEKMAVEVIASHRDKGPVLTGLYEFHAPASYVFREKLIYYYGFGAHAGYYKDEQGTWVDMGTKKELIIDTHLVPSIGFDGIFGVEYRLETYPINVGLDWKPFVSIFGPYTIWRNVSDFAFTVKYRFN